MLLAIANLVIAYPAVPTWARREALLFCVVIVCVFGSDSWTAAHLFVR
ncbi:MAG TPA: hypothetical protein VFU63_01960 [Ktedonobacterales bacterium]|nr:hypothetical protein [Ktedonobacterales bacterium]